MTQTADALPAPAAGAPGDPNDADGTPPNGWAVPLRRASPWERVPRVVLGVAFLAVVVLVTTQWLAHPRQIDPPDVPPPAPVSPAVTHQYAPLLADVEAGRTVRVDETASKVYWQNRDGARYSVYTWPLIDLRASIEAQPYVRAHPGAVTYGHVARGLDPDDAWWLKVVATLAGIACVGIVARGPEPRHLTRWGWAWACFTGVGVVPFLLLSGSWFTTGEPVRRRRVNGVVALLLLLPIAKTVGTEVLRDAYRREHPLHARLNYADPVRVRA